MKKSTLSNEYISSFCLEMSLLIHAGIGLEDGIYLLIEDETDKKMKKILEKITDILGEGRPLSEAIREVGCFPSYVCDMVETGEQTGRIEQSFQSLSAYYDRQMQLNDQVRSAILYPSILMVLMMVIIVVLLVKVLPIFNQVYTQLGGALSGTARILLNLGKFLGSCMPVLCVILGVVVLAVLVFGFSGSARGALMSLYQRIFGERGITRKIGEARFTSAMSMGLMSGLNTEDAFRNAMLFQSNVPKTKKRYEKCLELLESGEPMAEAFRENEIVDVKYCRIIGLGARSGMIDMTMEEVARRLDDSVQVEIERKVGKIEPTIVVITSILVGIILIAVMLPLINIMSSIG